MKAVLLIDFGSTYTKVTAVDVEKECIIGTAKAFTTVETDINEGLNVALDELFKKVGKVDFSEKLACSSAAGGLKMIAVGLVPELTAEAAQKAALNAGAKVQKVFSFELTQSDIDEITVLKPDIILLTGGTDGGNKSVILHNAKALANINHPFPVIVAGNRSVTDEIIKILQSSGKDVKSCQNVMPEFNVLNIEPAKECIRNFFLQRIIRAKGLSTVNDIISEIVMPTPQAVLIAASILASGYEQEEGFGEFMMVDVGGATTDVYSIAKGQPTREIISYKGLPEPFDKRTVEGDLGIRYSARFLAEEIGVDSLAKVSGLDVGKVHEYLTKIFSDPGILPDSKEFSDFDYALTYYAVKLATDRHVGRIEMHYSVNGAVFVQTGKDLSNISKIVGTGGPVINSINPKGALSGMFYDDNEENLLKPKKAEIYLDKQYIFAAMGLLAKKYPKQALRILKSNILRL